MSGQAKLMTAGGGGVNLTPASSIASDVTVNLPVTGVNNGTLVCSDSSGNVGIGTSSPSYKLHVYQSSGSASEVARFYGASTFAGISTGDATTTQPNYIWALGNAQTFWTNGSERMRIDSSGNLLVGTTEQFSGLNGRIATKIYTGGVNNGFVTQPDANVTTYPAVFLNSSSSTVGYISSGSSSTSYSTSSDYRLKENIQPMQNALATVAQLNPVTYTWKADGSNGQGFIAHELQAVVPDCVTGEKDAVDEEGKPVYQGIDTSFLVATLTKAIQEQQAQIETLTAKVAALEAK